MRSQALLAAVAMLAIALSGCADSDDGGSAPVSSSDPAPSDPLPEAPEAPDVPAQPEIEEEPEPIELDGSVSGVLDCQLVSQGQAALMGGSESIPAEAYGRSYSLSVIPDGTLPVEVPVASVCLYIDGAPASSSGSVPADASSFEIYADGAPNGIGYSILIE